jgi:myo-inositol 2-dehydrogenase/D-chiro-inositol 1-dehydrogenase
MFGAGRIAEVHARSVAATEEVELAYVIDVDESRAQTLAQRYGAKVGSQDQVLNDVSVGAVIIASPTSTHADLVEVSARAGKAIFCEKPIDLNLDRVKQCLKTVREHGVLFALGFMRRFDPTYRDLYVRLRAGEIGEIEQISIVNRDLSPPHLDFIGTSGGMVRDLTSHDLDLARWLLGEEIHSVYAVGSCLIDPEIGKRGDIDSLQASLTTASGKLVQISESRRSAYGYDQRIEVMGSHGTLQAANKLQSLVVHGGSAGATQARPVSWFLERYADAYKAQLQDFAEAVRTERAPLVGAADGLRAVELTEAALKSMRTGSHVIVDEAD